MSFQADPAFLININVGGRGREIYPSTKRTTDLSVGELVLWYGMFAPTDRYRVQRACPWGSMFILVTSSIYIDPSTSVGMTMSQ